MLKKVLDKITFEIYNIRNRTCSLTLLKSQSGSNQLNVLKTGGQRFPSRFQVLAF
jgi:hypothetical protein